jgi:hypothetical protein
MTFALCLVLSQLSPAGAATFEPRIPPTMRLLLEAEEASGTAPAKSLGQRPVAIALGAVAFLAAGLGLGLGVNANDIAGQANQSNSEYFFKILGAQAQGSATAANVAYGLAGAALVGAIIAFIVEG